MSSSVSLFWRECAWLLNCCRYCYLSWLCCHRSLLKCCLRSSSAALAHASSCRSVDSLLSLASSSFISAAAPSSDADRPAYRWTSSMAAATREATRAVDGESSSTRGGGISPTSLSGYISMSISSTDGGDSRLGLFHPSSLHGFICCEGVRDEFKSFPTSGPSTRRMTSSKSHLTASMSSRRTARPLNAAWMRVAAATSRIDTSIAPARNGVYTTDSCCHR